MANKREEICRGVKTFFVNPDVSLIPESFREDFFMNGYETYFLFDDPYCPLEKKIHILFSLFPELILFFNIDRKVAGIPDWAVFIGKLQTMYKDHAIIGVAYVKQQTTEISREYERMYLYDIGIQGGCFALEYQKSKNFAILNSVLMANQANGQRKSIRTLCDDNYKLSFVHNKTEYRATLTDLSISHFSCTFTTDLPTLEINEILSDGLFNFRGIHCKTKMMLVLQRVINGNVIFVFVFKTHDNHDGLEPDLRAKISGLIFQRTTEGIESILKQVFMLAAKTIRQPVTVNQ